MIRMALSLVAAVAASNPALAFHVSTPPSSRGTTVTTPTTLFAVDDRRAFLAAAAGTMSAAAFRTGPSNFAHAATSAVDYKAVSADVAALVQKNPDWGPTLVRLAWHSSGTYDKDTKTGGSGGGTIRFSSELKHGGNAGLADTAVQWLEPVYQKYKDDGLSYADLYTLAGGKCVCAGGRAGTRHLLGPSRHDGSCDDNCLSSEAVLSHTVHRPTLVLPSFSRSHSFELQ